MLKHITIALLVIGATISLLQGNNFKNKRVAGENDTISKTAYETYLRDNLVDEMRT